MSGPGAARPATQAGVIFDLDGVVLDSEELQYRAYREVLHAFGVDLSRDEFARQWIAEGGGPEYAVRAYRLPIGAGELRLRKNPVYRALLGREARLRSGASEALGRLRGTFPLALATNSSEADTRFVLERFGLAPSFTAVVTRERYVRAKPAPDAFLAAARGLGLPAWRCVAVEDSERGVLAASRAGCRCLAVPNEFTREHDFAPAARVLSGLEEVTVALVEALGAEGEAERGNLSAPHERGKPSAVRRKRDG